MSFDVNGKSFWDAPQLETELRRVSDICNGCRRCYNLCPSFNDLIDRLDSESVDGDAEKLTAGDFKSVTDLCYQCKLCYNHCPYTPPHRWEIDFPRLMLRSKAVETRTKRQSHQDRFLGQVDRLGKLGSMFAPMVNWLNGNRINRWMMEKFLGIHRDRILPPYAPETFRSWFDKRRPARISGTRTKVALFYTCSVNYNYPEVGRACVRVLEKNGAQIAAPEQRCCGMPFLDGGDIESTKKNARANVESLDRLARQGYEIVAPGPTCSYMLKREYPMMLEGEAVQRVAAKTLDICEYLMRLHGEGKLVTSFVKGMGRIAYQIPCHLRAQNIGYKSRDLMQLIPNTSVYLIERCAAIDGTWGLKRQYFDLSLKVAEPLLREIRDGRPDLIVSDCSLAGLQIQQGMSQKPLHPIQVLERAYGLEGETWA
jgi:Fe-S oxidoreductase